MIRNKSDRHFKELEKRMANADETRTIILTQLKMS